MTTLRTVDEIVADALGQVTRTDGATVSPCVGVPVPTSGYVVSLAGYGRTFSRTGTVAGLAEAITSYWRASRSVLAHGVRYLGVWRDLDTLYLDVSVIVSERVPALALARSQGQVAVWDIAAGAEVWT